MERDGALAPGRREAPTVGVVVIGRNEGDRLRLCLQSARGQALRIVYVDSGSRDGSPELARSLGASVVELDMSRPFTAARARNAGFARLQEEGPPCELVQFIDGDCEFEPGWIPAAAEFLESHPEVAVVAGRRKERHPEASVYNRLCDIEWDTPIGEADSCGGDSMIRASAFEEVEGFSPDLIAGEEPDLCWRLRQRGWKVYRIDAPMTLHDAAMTRFSQWWARNRRSGHAQAEAYERRGGRSNPELRRLVLSNVIWSLPPLWLLWPVLWWRIYRRRRDPAYAAFIVLGKLPHVQGQIRYWIDRRRGRELRLIEYK